MFKQLNLSELEIASYYILIHYSLCVETRDAQMTVNQPNFIPEGLMIRKLQTPDTTVTTRSCLYSR